ncbi:hypothetical protein ABG067_007839, partial [Albugo candida]
SMVDEEDEIIYNVTSAGVNTFTETELNSIQFSDICDTYGVSREAARELMVVCYSMVKMKLNVPIVNQKDIILPKVLNPQEDPKDR